MRNGGHDPKKWEPVFRLDHAQEKLTALRQALHHVVELLEAAIADLDGAAGIAVMYRDGQTERVADALLQRDGVGIFRLGAGPRLLRLAFRHAFFMRKLFRLTH